VTDPHLSSLSPVTTIRAVPLLDFPRGKSAGPGRHPVAATLHSLIALAATTGVTLATLTAPSLTRLFGYFAIQANCLLALVALCSAWCAWSGRPALPAWLTGASVLYITIAALAYHSVLTRAGSGFVPAGPPHRLATQLIHTATPIAAVAEWFLLTAPHRFRPRHAFLWPLYPLAYLAFALHRHTLPLPGTFTHYPYPFVPLHPHAHPALLRDAAIFTITIWLLAVLLVALDQLRPSLTRAETGFRLRSRVR
jgi:hypothetical protein